MTAMHRFVVLSDRLEWINSRDCNAILTTGGYAR